VRTILLLLASNLFMTLAWYGHLKVKGAPLWAAILVSWLIALPEYALQVPANRWGHGQFTLTQLKVLQEVISLVVFAGFALWAMDEPPTWNYLPAGLCLVAAVGFIFYKS
jgi:uncharacterized protein (DUF486 family)